MRMSQDEKEKSRARIVARASRLFRERGLDGASVADVMQEAGMTHGGFYKHFASKDALAAAALADAFAQLADALGGQEVDAAATEAFPGLAAASRGGEVSGRAIRSAYLSPAHVAQRGLGCPVAALGSEIARGPAPLKRAFGAGVRRMVDAIVARRRGSEKARRTAALREFSMLVGAMVIARASDAELADEVLTACRGGSSDVH